jgi:hypothetical protein
MTDAQIVCVSQIALETAATAHGEQPTAATEADTLAMEADVMTQLERFTKELPNMEGFAAAVSSPRACCVRLYLLHGHTLSGLPSTHS